MSSSHLLPHYVQWRKNRVKKLTDIYGPEYFKGKRILELGCGHGHVGKFFSMLGGLVTFADGRFGLYDAVAQNNPGANFIVIDQDLPWTLSDKFDVIIHWGVLYHLDNWQQDLACTVACLEKGGILCVETETMDSDQDEEVKVKENKELDDQALNSTGTKPSAVRVENEFTKLGLKFTRYDDSDLNTIGGHWYDWKVANTKSFGSAWRRFWICST